MGQHRSRESWAQLVAEYEQVSAHQTVRSFAKRRGVSEKSLSNWRSKLRREPAQTLVPVVVRTPTHDVDAPVAVVRLGDGATIELLDLERTPAIWVAALVHELSRKGS